MLPRSIHYASDSFQFRKQALLKSRQPLDFSYETSVASLQISGTEPEGCNRRIIFEIDGKNYKFTNAGLTIYDDRAELDDILTDGNTVGELLALENITDFVGKKVYPIIALDAPTDSPVFPRIKISATVNSYNDIYTKYFYSPVYGLSGNAKISEILDDVKTNGNGIGTLQCRLFNNGRWGDWIYLPDAKYQPATQIQFRINCILSTLDGSDSVNLGQVYTFFSTDKDKLSGLTTEIFSKDLDYPADLGTCYLLVKHSQLKDCTLKAFVKFSNPVTRRDKIFLGTADGTQQTFYLTANSVVDKNVAQDTLHITADGKSVSDFYFDTANSTVTFKATAGAEILASYECGLSDELWREMELDFSQDNEGTISSRFIFRLSDTNNQRVSAIRLTLTRGLNFLDNQRLATATGKLQTFALEHKVRPETIDCTGNWKYDDTTQLLKVVAPIGSDIIASYAYFAEPPDFYQIIAGWETSTRG